MPELAYLREQHAASMPRVRDGAGLSELLEQERALLSSCGRAALQRLSLPPDTGNVREVAARMRLIQLEHDAYLSSQTMPETVSAAEWEAFRKAWEEMAVLDMNILCEYCAETGRDVRKRVRAGNTEPEVIEARVRAICEVGARFPGIARSSPRALRDFCQQGILDLRRLRAVLQGAGLDTGRVDETIAALTREKRKIAR